MSDFLAWDMDEGLRTHHKISTCCEILYRASDWGGFFAVTYKRIKHTELQFVLLCFMAARLGLLTLRAGREPGSSYSTYRV
jgi:hypothetical protein